MKNISVIMGDITKVSSDIIVNSANKSLLRGCGVDGAIHRAAGQELEKECVKLGGCEEGSAKVTKSFNLEKNGVKWIIHAVGPRWLGGYKNEKYILKNTYKSVFEVLNNHDKNIQSIAFVSISTGIYNFPIKLAARIALDEMIKFSEEYDSQMRILIVCKDIKTYEIYKKYINEWKEDADE